MTTWTQGITERMRSHHAGSLSCSQIAVELNDEFGTGFTRNSIIGKLHRLGLRSVHVTPEEQARRQLAAKVRIEKRRAARPPATFHAKPAPVYKETTEESDKKIPESQRCSLMELTEITCRWPIGTPGTPEFFYCGSETSAGQPYCPGHCRRAFNYASGQRAAA